MTSHTQTTLTITQGAINSQKHALYKFECARTHPRTHATYIHFGKHMRT